jgi:hypothetical protein
VFAQPNRLYLAVVPGVPAKPPLAAPTALTATAQAGRKVRLAWRDNAPDEDSYRIEMRIGTAAFREVVSVGAGKTSVVLSGLTAGTTYTFRVRARKGTTFSTYSNLATAKAIP